MEKGLASISAGKKKDIYTKWIPVEPRPSFAGTAFKREIFAAVALILMIVSGICT